MPVNLTLDRLDFDFGERLAVTVFLAVAFAAFFVKTITLSPFTWPSTLALIFSAFDVGGADGYFAVRDQ
jgi:hypothetical protein